ncbi:Hsp20/alpha crystallin family protein [Microbispora sp. RL4-1S]|uniref:Hsp20/alpha crystallin family protein n=1 Tax=Microbispora oryzae TaxID=2806554 RepID=A0A940WPQ7_9ACTN|nr:Hsp20/alpha crystallin family protein [Microbispora oryzae]MBP2706998.1 Hsp20/alpha crystallin family protein [Microbispora oryzae]
MSVPMKREQRGLMPDLFDLLELPLAGFRPTGQQIRFEDYTDDGRYVLRAEVPGIDPERDVEITVANGILTIHAERRQEEKRGHRTEFRYGSFTRSIPLPPNADENDVKASYDNGILEVKVRLAEEKERAKRIPISMEKGSTEKGSTEQGTA